MEWRVRMSKSVYSEEEYIPPIFIAEFFGGPFNGRIAHYDKLGVEKTVVPSEITVTTKTEGNDGFGNVESIFTMFARYVYSPIQQLNTRVRYDYVSEVTEGEIAQTHAESNRS